MSFGGIIASMLSSIIKSSFKVDLFLDESINKLKTNEFSTELIKKTIEDKNNIVSGLEGIQNRIDSIDSTSKTINNVIKGLSSLKNTITTIPIPVSVAPAPGLPIGVLSKYSEVLTEVKNQIDLNKNSLDGARKSLNLISSINDGIQNKIDQLDNLLVEKIESNNLTDEERQELIDSINITDKSNISQSEDLNEKLSINSKNPIIYRNYKLQLELDPNNKLKIPRRRIKAIKIISPFNIIVKEYSYTTKLKVLIEEIKIKINQKDPIFINK